MTATELALAEQLLATGRAGEALKLTEPAANMRLADLKLWTVRGQALKALSRLDDAIEAYRIGAEIAPQSGVAEHNFAGALGDAQRFAEAEAATRRAFAKGLDAPETWMVHARALMGQARFEESEQACREALRRRPAYAEAHGDLAQLLWMQTEDAVQACASLEAAIAANPGALLLRMQLARFRQYVGDLQGAYAALLPVMSGPDIDPGLSVLASQLLVYSDPSAALAHAELAYAAWPDAEIAIANLCEANLAAGHAEAAARLAQNLRERDPLDQHAIGLLAIAWRMLGDKRYSELYDYDRVVKAWTIDTPDGWPNLDAYLVDLQKSLTRLHPVRGHPVGLSLRHGSQTLQGLDRVDDPVVAAFFQAIAGPIHRHIAWLGEGGDPLRARITGGYKFNGVWSARLRPTGYHTNHLHPRGWLSSACYIALPSAVERGKEGWIKFGEPGIPTAPALAAEHFVKPEPGLLVLFPSYMWHGTVPFSGDENRLTIAFDLLPA